MCTVLRFFFKEGSQQNPIEIQQPSTTPKPQKNHLFYKHACRTIQLEGSFCHRKLQVKSLFEREAHSTLQIKRQEHLFPPRAFGGFLFQAFQAGALQKDMNTRLFKQPLKNLVLSMYRESSNRDFPFNSFLNLRILNYLNNV